MTWSFLPRRWLLFAKRFVYQRFWCCVPFCPAYQSPPRFCVYIPQPLAPCLHSDSYLSEYEITRCHWSWRCIPWERNFLFSDCRFWCAVFWCWPRPRPRTLCGRILRCGAFFAGLAVSLARLFRRQRLVLENFRGAPGVGREGGEGVTLLGCHFFFWKFYFWGLNCRL